PTSFRGPTVTRRVLGGGWSTWSQRYQVSGQRVSSPSPRRYVQIQARMLSSSPELAAVLRSVRLETLSPAAVRSFAEVWPAEVELGIPSDFEVFVRPMFVERDPGNQASSRFDEVLLDPAPIQNLELLGVALGSETALADGSAQQFTSLAMRTDPASGAPTSWFEAPDGDLYQALVDPVSGDSLKILQGRVAAGSEPQQSAPLLLRLPRKVASLPVGIDTRGYHRRIVEEGDEVPVDDDGRPLNELTYLNLPIDQQGTILYFELTGSTALGELILAAVDEFAYRALPDSAQGEIRYFRKLVGKGGEFAYDRQGEVLSLEAYDALPSAEKGSILAAGELLRIDFRAKVLLNGTTLDVAIRDSGADPAWQSVDPGDATTLRPGAELSIAVPFDRVVVRALTVEPPVITPNGDGLNDQGEIRFSIANVNLARQIDLRVYDLGGRIVWQESRMSFGDQVFFWDGRDNNGNLVAPGIYLCRVEVDADSGQASRLADQRSIAVAY
ncbi:MAG TPA: gliding motility-associated C-terminal domain-containing protein, partial [Candidatus Latescibacteria bacterium]|nr:gliding motility-associated C-terminal domain-containing protein [Candidatus Latescibacterota bacterium]